MAARTIAAILAVSVTVAAQTQYDIQPSIEQQNYHYYQPQQAQYHDGGARSSSSFTFGPRRVAVQVNHHSSQAYVNNNEGQHGVLGYRFQPQFGSRFGNEFQQQRIQQQPTYQTPNYNPYLTNPINGDNFSIRQPLNQDAYNLNINYNQQPQVQQPQVSRRPIQTPTHNFQFNNGIPQTTNFGGFAFGSSPNAAQNRFDPNLAFNVIPNQQQYPGYEVHDPNQPKVSHKLVYSRPNNYLVGSKNEGPLVNNAVQALAEVPPFESSKVVTTKQEIVKNTTVITIDENIEEQTITPAPISPTIPTTFGPIIEQNVQTTPAQDLPIVEDLKVKKLPTPTPTIVQPTPAAPIGQNEFYEGLRSVQGNGLLYDPNQQFVQPQTPFQVPQHNYNLYLQPTPGFPTAPPNIGGFPPNDYFAQTTQSPTPQNNFISYQTTPISPPQPSPSTPGNFESSTVQTTTIEQSQKQETLLSVNGFNEKQPENGNSGVNSIVEQTTTTKIEETTTVTVNNFEQSTDAPQTIVNNEQVTEFPSDFISNRFGFNAPTAAPESLPSLTQLFNGVVPEQPGSDPRVQQPGLEQNIPPYQQPGLQQGIPQFQQPGIQQGVQQYQQPGLQQGVQQFQQPELQQGIQQFQQPELQQGVQQFQHPELQGVQQFQQPELQQGVQQFQQPELQQNVPQFQQPGLQQGVPQFVQPELQQGVQQPEQLGPQQFPQQGIPQGTPQQPGVQRVTPYKLPALHHRVQEFQQQGILQNVPPQFQQPGFQQGVPEYQQSLTPTTPQYPGYSPTVPPNPSFAPTTPQQQISVTAQPEQLTAISRTEENHQVIKEESHQQTISTPGYEQSTSAPSISTTKTDTYVSSTVDSEGVKRVKKIRVLKKQRLGDDSQEDSFNGDRISKHFNNDQKFVSKQNEYVTPESREPTYVTPSVQSVTRPTLPTRGRGRYHASIAQRPALRTRGRDKPDTVYVYAQRAKQNDLEGRSNNDQGIQTTTANEESETTTATSTFTSRRTYTRPNSLSSIRPPSDFGQRRTYSRFRPVSRTFPPQPSHSTEETPTTVQTQTTRFRTTFRTETTQEDEDQTELTNFVQSTTESQQISSSTLRGRTRYSPQRGSDNERPQRPVFSLKRQNINGRLRVTSPVQDNNEETQERKTSYSVETSPERHVIRRFKVKMNRRLESDGDQDASGSVRSSSLQNQVTKDSNKEVPKLKSTLRFPPRKPLFNRFRLTTEKTQDSTEPEDTKLDDKEDSTTITNGEILTTERNEIHFESTTTKVTEKRQIEQDQDVADLVDDTQSVSDTSHETDDIPQGIVYIPFLIDSSKSEEVDENIDIRSEKSSESDKIELEAQPTQQTYEIFDTQPSSIDVAKSEIAPSAVPSTDSDTATKIEIVTSISQMQQTV